MNNVKKKQTIWSGRSSLTCNSGELQLGVNCWKKQVVVSLKLEISHCFCLCVVLLILQLQLGVNCWNKQVVVSLKLETQKIGGIFRTSTNQRSSFRLYQNGVNLADITTYFTKKRYKYALKWPKCF